MGAPEEAPDLVLPGKDRLAQLERQTFENSLTLARIEAHEQGMQKERSERRASFTDLRAWVTLALALLGSVLGVWNAIHH